MSKRATYISVLAISIALSLLNSLPFILGTYRKPPNTRYMAVAHFPMDFFYYVSNMVEGQDGKWHVSNLYTNEPTQPNLTHWENVLMGKVAGVFRIKQEIAYNIYVFMFSVASLFLLYCSASLFFPDSPFLAFTAFIFGAFSTSFMNIIRTGNSALLYPFQLWKTPHFAFDRLGGVPHQLLTTILFYILVILFQIPGKTVKIEAQRSKRPRIFTIIDNLFPIPKLKSAEAKKGGHPSWLSIRWLKAIGFSRRRNKCLLLVSIFIVTLMLTTIQPFPPLLFLGSLYISKAVSLIYKKRLKEAVNIKILSSSFAWLAGFMILSVNFSFPPYTQAKAWEALQQNSSDLLFLLLSVGPVAVFGFFGVKPVLRYLSTMSLSLVFMPFLCYALYLSPVPKLLGIANDRVLFPGLYLFLGVLGSVGLFSLTKYILRALPNLAKSRVPLILIFFFLMLSLPTLAWELEQKVSFSQDLEKSYTLYVPHSINKALESLRYKGGKHKVVLGNPITGFDTIIPALTGQKTYSGHILFTINASLKSTNASRFFTMSIASQEAYVWLKESGIDYVLFTKFDGDLVRFERAYPFLIPIQSFDGTKLYSLGLL